MSSRVLRFQPKPKSGSQHREHRSKKGRDPKYRLKRKARVLYAMRLGEHSPRKHDLIRWTQELGG